MNKFLKYGVLALIASLSIVILGLTQSDTYLMGFGLKVAGGSLILILYGFYDANIDEWRVRKHIEGISTSMVAFGYITAVVLEHRLRPDRLPIFSSAPDDIVGMCQFLYSLQYTNFNILYVIALTDTLDVFCERIDAMAVNKNVIPTREPLAIHEWLINDVRFQ